MLELLGLSFLIMGASLVGVVTVWGRAGSFIGKNLDYLVSFSSGVFLIFFYGLTTGGVEHAGGRAGGLFWLLVGAVGIWLILKILPGSHVHVHAHEHGESHRPLDPRRMLLTDGIHNAADVIFLAASYAVSPSLAAMAGASI